MDYYSASHTPRKSRRQAFLLGRRSALSPSTRDATLALARRALTLLPLQDRHAPFVESALSDVSTMLRVVSMSLATITVIARRLSGLERALMIDRAVTDARWLVDEPASNGRSGARSA
jgi:hypothetical protein